MSGQKFHINMEDELVSKVTCSAELTKYHSAIHIKNKMDFHFLCLNGYKELGNTNEITWNTDIMLNPGPTVISHVEMHHKCNKTTTIKWLSKIKHSNNMISS